MKKYILIIIISAIFASCSENKVATSVSVGSISGKVVKATNFAPIDSALVTITPSNNTVFTNAKGEFKFSDVAVGDYSVSATKRGFRERFKGASITEGKSINLILDLEVENSGNRPPSAPVLISPVDKSINQKLTLALQWSTSVDPDNDTVNYDLEVRNDKNNNIISVASLKDTTYTLSNLSYGVKYFWQVSAKDSLNPSVQSLVSTFQTNSNPANRFLYVRKSSSGNNVIYSSDSIGTGSAITVDSKNSWRPRKSRSANLIAFLQTTNTNTQLFTMNSDGSNVFQVTQSIPVAGFDPGQIDFSWSANGQELLYPNFDKLYRINKDGSGLQLVYQTPDGSLITECSWSNDGSFIALKTNDLNGYKVKIYTIDMAGNTIDTILSGVNGAAGGLDISVDGKKVLYTYDTSGFEDPSNRQLDSNLYIYDRTANTSALVASQKTAGTNDLDPRFSPNEAEIIFVNTSNDGVSEKFIYKLVLPNNSNSTSRTLLYSNATMPDWE